MRQPAGGQSLSMSKPSILVVGSSNTDMLIKLGRIPRPGETVLGGEFATAPGGKGANQAVAAARAGGAVTLIARLGQDMFGDRAIAGFVADGIEVEYVLRDATAPSGVALIFVGRDGENSIAVASGANANLVPADLKRARAAFGEARVVLLQLETPLKTVETAARLAVNAGARLILNPAPARALPEHLLRQVYLLTPNETETEILTGLTVTDEVTAARAADALLARGVQNVLITLGARGAFLAGAQARGFVPAFKVKALDTTGAGDVFNGTLAVGLAEGKSLPEAARFASAAAALSVTRLGAQTSAPLRREIERWLASANGSARPVPGRGRSGRRGVRETLQAA